MDVNFAVLVDVVVSNVRSALLAIQTEKGLMIDLFTELISFCIILIVSRDRRIH